MTPSSTKRFRLLLLALVILGAPAFAAERTWTDVTGRFSVTAELVAVEGDRVVLRRADGGKVEVALKQLSDKDRAFIETLRDGGPADDRKEAVAGISEAARAFFTDLRGTDRQAARRLLTEKARPLMEGAHSPLAQLPQPAPGAGAVAVGKPELDGKVAEVPVRVRTAGAVHRTKLHLRLEDDHWRIFAISATYPDGEKSLDFEAETAKPAGPDAAPAGVGQPMELAGYLLDGRPLNMADYKGKVVLVDFWATWCGPCRAEKPNILENWNKYRDRGFEVIAISVDRDLEALQAYVAEEQPPWAIVADQHPSNRQSMAARYGVRGIPSLFLLDREGNVAAVNCRGPRLGQELARLLGDPR